MKTERTVFVTPQLVMGILIVLLGILFILHNLGVLEVEDYLRFWPVVLIAIGLTKVLQTRDGRGAGLVLVIVGTLLLLDTLNFFGFDVWDFWPLVLVFVGASLIWRASTRGKVEQAADSSAKVQAIAILGGVERTVNSQDFRGGELTAILGGCEIDLREASISEGAAVLDAFALCGGIELRVPDDWRVIVRGIPLLGAFSDKTRPPKAGPEKRLIVKGTAIMGGVEISN